MGDALLHLVVAVRQGEGHGHVKHHVGVGDAPHHPEIVHGGLGVHHVEQAAHLLPQLVGALVAGDHGVQVDDKLNAHVPLEVPLDVVDDVVADQDVLLGGHLAVDRGKALALAVVVDGQIVDAENARVGEDFLVDSPHQGGVGGGAQQGVARLHNQLDAGHHNEHRHGQAQKAVQVHAGKAGDKGPQQHHRGGNGVVAAVAGGGEHRVGVDGLAHAAVEKALPQLQQHGHHQNDKGQGAEVRGLGRDDFLKGGAAQLQAQKQHDEGHNHPGEVLDAGVAKGVLFVGGLACQLKAHQHDDGGAGVRQVVHGVGHDGHTAGHQPRRQLDGKQQQIGGDAHGAGHLAAFLPHLGGVLGAVARDKGLHNGIKQSVSFPSF